VKKSRKALGKGEDWRREAVLRDGEVFNGESVEKKIVVTEMRKDALVDDTGKEVPKLVPVFAHTRR